MLAVQRGEEDAERVGRDDGIVVEDPEVRGIGEVRERDLLADGEAAAAAEIRAGHDALRGERVRGDGIGGGGVVRVIHDDCAAEWVRAFLQGTEQPPQLVRATMRGDDGDDGAHVAASAATGAAPAFTMAGVMTPRAMSARMCSWISGHA